MDGKWGKFIKWCIAGIVALVVGIAFAVWRLQAVFCTGHPHGIC